MLIKIAAISNKLQHKKSKHHCEDQAFLHHRKKILRRIRSTNVLKSRFHILPFRVQNSLKLNKYQFNILDALFLYVIESATTTNTYMCVCKV